MQIGSQTNNEIGNKIGNEFVDNGKYIKPALVGAVHPKQGRLDGECNNCTVRALANCTGLSYDTCHELLRQAGRKDRCGMYFKDYFPVYLKHGIKKFTIVGETMQARSHANSYFKITSEKPKQIKGMTIKTFLSKPEYQRGVFAVEVSGHIFTVRNGLIYDIGLNSANKRVCCIMHF